MLKIFIYSLKIETEPEIETTAPSLTRKFISKLRNMGFRWLSSDVEKSDHDNDNNGGAVRRKRSIKTEENDQKPNRVIQKSLLYQLFIIAAKRWR